MAEFQVRNPPGLNESTNGIIPRLNASSFPVSGVVSDHVTSTSGSAAVAAAAADTVTRPKWFNIYDEMFGSDEDMDESVDYRAISNKRKPSKPNAIYGSSTRPVVLLSDEKPGALDEAKLQVIIRKYSPDNLEIHLDNLPAYFKQYFGYDFSLKGKLIDFFETTRFPSIEVVKRNQRAYIKLVREKNKTKKKSKLSSASGMLQTKIFLKRNKRLVLEQESRPIVKHKIGPRTIPSNDWALSQQAIVKSSIVAIKEEKQTSKKRKSEDITQAKKSIKSKTDSSPSPQKKDTSSTLSYTEKQRIQNILQKYVTKNVLKMDYLKFRKTYQHKYGEMLNVESAIVREFIKTMPSWRVTRGNGLSKHYYLEYKNMPVKSKEDKQKSNKSTSSSPIAKISREQRHLTSPISTPNPKIENSTVSKDMDRHSLSSTNRTRTTRTSTAAAFAMEEMTAHENTSASVPNDSRIIKLLEKQIDLSKKILEAQLKQYEIDEQKVLLSEQLLEAQLRKNVLDEERNVILLFDSVNEATAKANDTKSEDKEEMLSRLREKYLQKPTMTTSMLTHKK